MRCDLCKEKNCDNGSPCFTKESEALYQDTVELEMMRAASSIEAEYYGELNRIQEIILFANDIVRFFSFVYLRGKVKAIFPALQFKYRNREFWCRGYYVDTAGKNANKIAEYIKN